jgi:hypothetical protein
MTEGTICSVEVGALLLGAKPPAKIQVRSHLPRSAAASCVHRSDQGAYFVKM